MQSLFDFIASVLRVPGDWLRELVIAVPMSAVRVIFLVYYLVLLVWVMTMRKSEVCGALPGKKKPLNLRFYAALALIIQIVLYAVF